MAGVERSEPPVFRGLGAPFGRPQPPGIGFETASRRTAMITSRFAGCMDSLAGKRRFSSSRFRSPRWDATNALRRRRSTAKPRVANGVSAPWVVERPEPQPQRGCTIAKQSQKQGFNDCRTPSGYVILTPIPTQGGAASPLTLGFVVKPLRGK